MGKNNKFLTSAILNDATFIDYLNRFQKIALSIFEWVNLPPSMDAIFLEKCLYLYGQATLLKDKKYGFINTKCSASDKLNIYGLPSAFNCYSFEYQTTRKLYTGLKNEPEEASCILVQNNWFRIPTAGSMELFSYRLYEAQRTADVNIKAQKTPIMVVGSDKQRLMLENLYNQYNGNQPFIFGDKNQLDGNMLTAIKTEAPYVADKIQDYKKEIWNEALTFLGINNIMVDKKERLITDEANSNNELINLNLQSYLAPRQKACDQFNKKFNLIGTGKEISVRVRSDLHNIIKNAQSIVNDFKEKENIEDIKIESEGNENE